MKRSFIITGLSALGGLLLIVGTACSSDSGTSVCTATIGGSPVCVTYTNADSNSAKTDCSNISGTIASSCATGSQVGCCSYTNSSGVGLNVCYYCGDGPTLQTAYTSLTGSNAQNPKWTAGSGPAASCTGGGAMDSGTTAD
jgi:alpha-glucosidase (family GH31 glycosyl hydrolase)